MIREGNKFQWQKSFYDHVIRNEKSLASLREYIINNPLKWELDIENRKDRNERFSQDACKDYYRRIVEGLPQNNHNREVKR